MTALLTRDDTMPATLTPTAPLDAPAFRPAQPSRTNGHLTPASNPLAFNAEGYPAFFDQAPTLTVQDGLARFLGATRDGILTYRYLDAVRLAGHSCPTVAGSWLMVIRGLKALYGDDIPERGNIDVLMRDERHEGTTGVIASIATLLTGAAAETGFHGIGPVHRFKRQDLLQYGAASIDGMLVLKRRDTGAAVQVELNAGIIPFHPDMQALLPKAVSGYATPAEMQRFGEVWQERVRAILIDHADDDALVQIRPWSSA